MAANARNICTKCSVSLVGKPKEVVGTDVLCTPCYDKGNADILSMLKISTVPSSVPQSCRKGSNSATASSVNVNSCHGCRKEFRPQDTRISWKIESWHERCFTCTNCKSEIGYNSFYTVDGSHYCTSCHTKLFRKRCTLCTQHIMGNSTIFKGDPYHPECFTCAKCRKMFPKHGRIYSRNDGGGYHCLDCFCTKYGKTCHKCHKQISPIDGGETEFKSQYYHGHCLACARCGKIFGKSDSIYSGKSNTNEYLCVPCYDLRYSPTCSRCRKVITVEETRTTSGSHAWHQKCLGCNLCGRSLVSLRIVINNDGSVKCVNGCR